MKLKTKQMINYNWRTKLKIYNRVRSKRKFDHVMSDKHSN
jgi:hypothetical protein